MAPSNEFYSYLNWLTYFVSNLLLKSESNSIQGLQCANKQAIPSLRVATVSITKRLVLTNTHPVRHLCILLRLIREL